MTPLLFHRYNAQHQEYLNMMSGRITKSKIKTGILLFTVLSAVIVIPGRVFAEDYGGVDKLKKFVSRENDSVLTNAAAIESTHRMALSLKTLPWSSTFWPDNSGSVADPYAESSSAVPYFNELSWGYTKMVLGNRGKLHQDIVEGHASDQTIANLSPAEKYDMLLGDPNFTFFNKVIARVNQLDSLGLLGLSSLWSGICHGWTPASLYMPRPEHLFYAVAPNGRRIPFYPYDVKALESIAWGDAFGPGGAQYFAKVEGSRCVGNGKTDKYGRLTDESCFDTNPAFLHLTAINQIALNQRGFIMDRALKNEVQNQPVFAYSFKYYKVTDRNPHPGQTLAQAKVSYATGFFDPYRKYRSPKAKALVGVEATLWYGNDSGILPNHDTTDDVSKDQHKTYTIRYDLELDDQDEIVGGEWREYDQAEAPTLFEQVGYKHPDLIWLIPPAVEPFSLGDWDVLKDTWDVSGATPAAVPASYLPASLKSDAWTERQTFKGRPVDKMYPQPLLQVVKGLVEMSRK